MCIVRTEAILFSSLELLPNDIGNVHIMGFMLGLQRGRKSQGINCEKLMHRGMEPMG